MRRLGPRSVALSCIPPCHGFLACGTHWLSWQTDSHDRIGSTDRQAGTYTAELTVSAQPLEKMPQGTLIQRVRAQSSPVSSMGPRTRSNKVLTIWLSQTTHRGKNRNKADILELLSVPWELFAAQRKNRKKVASTSFEREEILKMSWYLITQNVFQILACGVGYGIKIKIIFPLQHHYHVAAAATVPPPASWPPPSLLLSQSLSSCLKRLPCFIVILLGWQEEGDYDYNGDDGGHDDDGGGGNGHGNGDGCSDGGGGCGDNHNHHHSHHIISPLPPWLPPPPIMTVSSSSSPPLPLSHYYHNHQYHNHHQHSHHYVIITITASTINTTTVTIITIINNSILTTLTIIICSSGFTLYGFFFSVFLE